MRLLSTITSMMAFVAAVVWAQDDQPSGTYTSTMPSSVTPSPTSLQSVHPDTGALPSKLELHCSGNKMSDNYAIEMTKASGLLNKTCKDGNNIVIPIRSAVYWFNDDTQIYYCNYQWTVQETCSIDEFSEASQFLDIACGEEMGGWVYLPEWGESIGRDPVNPDGSRRRECF